MGQKPDKLTVDDAAWLRAMSREKIIRPLALLPRLSAAHVGRSFHRSEIEKPRKAWIYGFSADPYVS